MSIGFWCDISLKFDFFLGEVKDESQTIRMVQNLIFDQIFIMIRPHIHLTTKQISEMKSNNTQLRNNRLSGIVKKMWKQGNRSLAPPPNLVKSKHNKYIESFSDWLAVVFKRCITYRNKIPSWLSELTLFVIF